MSSETSDIIVMGEDKEVTIDPRLVYEPVPIRGDVREFVLTPMPGADHRKN